MQLFWTLFPIVLLHILSIPDLVGYTVHDTMRHGTQKPLHCLCQRPLQRTLDSRLQPLYNTEWRFVCVCVRACVCVALFPLVLLSFCSSHGFICFVFFSHSQFAVRSLWYIFDHTEVEWVFFTLFLFLFALISTFKSSFSKCPRSVLDLPLRRISDPAPAWGWFISPHKVGISWTKSDSGNGLQRLLHAPLLWLVLTVLIMSLSSVNESQMGNYSSLVVNTLPVLPVPSSFFSVFFFENIKAFQN